MTPDGVRVSCAVSAVSAVGQYYTPHDRVTVEWYPPQRDYWGLRPRTVFAFQFFNAAGRNVATYIPDLGGVQFHGPEGRAWGIPRGETWDIDEVKRFEGNRK